MMPTQWALAARAVAEHHPELVPVMVGDHDVGPVEVLGHRVGHGEAGHPGAGRAGRIGIDQQAAVAGVGGVAEQVAGHGGGEHGDERAVGPRAAALRARLGARLRGRLPGGG
jgi:hypothetical protein